MEGIINEPVLACMYAILVTNDIVCSWELDSLGELKKHPHLFRHRVKQLVKAMEADRLRYEHMVNGLLRHNSEFFGNAAHIVSEKTKPCVTKLYHCISDNLARHSVPDADVIARFETLRSLADVACTLYDKHAEALFKNSGQRLKGAFKLTHMYGLLRRLQDIICSLPGSIDLNEDDDCVRALDDVVNTFCNYGMFLDAVYTSEEETLLDDASRGEEVEAPCS